MINFCIYDPLFRRYVTVLVGSADEAMEIVKKHFVGECIKDVEESVTPLNDGCCFSIVGDNDGCIYRYLWIKDDDQFNATLVHETLHLASGILRDIGIEHTGETEEIYAYYPCYLMGVILDRVKKIKKNRSGKSGKSRKK